jgi:hypothetical protein
MPQLRLPVKRLFVGIAGSPLSRVTEAAKVAESAVTSHDDLISTSPKRGRKPKGDRAMTLAERQKDCRLQRKSQQVIEAHHDYKGRLHDETSGGNSMQKIDRIIAARDRKELYGGQKPVRGAGPDVFDKTDPTVDLADVPTAKKYPRRIIRFPHNWGLDGSDKERVIDELASDLFEGEEASSDSDSTLTCKLCGTVVVYWPNARSHVHQEYQKGVKQRAFYNQTLKTATESGDPTWQTYLQSVWTELQNNQHLPVIEKWLRANAPKKTSKAFRRAA